MKNKKYILCYLFVLFAFLKLFPQGSNKGEKIEALRVAFITKKLNLTADESQKFWPVYNEYQDKLKASWQEFKKQPTVFTNDKEAQNYLDAELLLKQREFSLYKEYYDKIKKIIPVKKVAELRQAEDDFKKELLKQLQGKSND
ncbi:MAG TPA: hypothetical protein VN698_16325 [Bacteroidia bacterium]|nr:hypothetical protein [Bacteroidia bacterium]